MAAAKRAARRVIRVPHKKNDLYYGMQYSRVETYSNALLRTVRSELGGAAFFTREDLLQLPAFQHISTIYRYGIICTLVRFLMERGDLVSMKRTDLVFKENTKKYDPEPLAERYEATVRNVVRSLNGSFGVMDVVAVWKTDTDLTINNKRVAARGVLARMLREKKLKKQNEFEYAKV